MKRDKVHVVICGWSPERHYPGAFRKGADRIYLIRGKITDDTEWWNKKSKELIRKSRKQFEVLTEIIDVKIDVADYFKCFEALSKLFKKESKRGSEIFLNLSDGQRIITAAAIGAASMFNVKAYYAFPKKYNTIFKKIDEQFSYGCKKIADIPLISTGNISYREKQILKLIYTEGACLIGELSTKMKMRGSRTKMNYYINKLAETGLIKTKQEKSKVRVSLSESGRLVALSLD